MANVLERNKDQLQDLFQSFIDYLKFLLTPIGLQDYAGFIAAVPFFLLLYVIYLISIRSVRISFKKVGMHREATSGVIFGIRLFFFGFGFLTLVSMGGDALRDYAITAGALFGTAIGFAFSRALANLVSGIYVLAARPFRVGDYIRIGESEGMVLEITLNYTRLLRPDHTRQFVPNVMTLDSRLTNFRVRIDDYLDERGLDYKFNDDDNDSRLDDAIDRLKYLTKGDEVYRYTFDVEVERTCSRPKVKKYFTEVCEKWASKFIQPPEFIFWGSTATTLVYRFAFMVHDPKEIIFTGNDFREEASEFPPT